MEDEWPVDGWTVAHVRLRLSHALKGRDPCYLNRAPDFHVNENSI